MSKEIEQRKCIVSPMYGKDEFNNLYFYCDYCGEEMGYEEERECNAELELCPNCKNPIGNSERSVGTCFECDKTL